MARTCLGVATAGFIGWFGPRGLASIIFALLTYDALGSEAATLMARVSVPSHSAWSCTV